jgi:hypothetical protein
VTSPSEAFVVCKLSGVNLLENGAVQTFSTWQFSSTLTCPFPRELIRWRGRFHSWEQLM